MKRESSQFTSQSICAPVLSSGHERWVVTKRMTSHKQAAKMITSVWVEPSKRGEELRADCSSFMFKRSQLHLNWSGCLLDSWLLPVEAFRARPPGVRPRTHWYHKSHLAWERLGTPRRSWRTWIERRASRFFAQPAATKTPTKGSSRKWMDWWRTR